MASNRTVQKQDTENISPISSYSTHETSNLTPRLLQQRVLDVMDTPSQRKMHAHISVQHHKIISQLFSKSFQCLVFNTSGSVKSFLFILVANYSMIQYFREHLSARLLQKADFRYVF
mmetsp:Transcript_27778/g.41629  ORF Transcript_27778/g.41629 Transcript_27778/m.41629 type:complete len:117 (-) Transcript_27778:330-680(-)